MKTWVELGINVFGRTSGRLYTTCPNCSIDRKKSKAKCLSVDISEGLYNCHHCGFSGKVATGKEWRPLFPKSEPKPPKVHKKSTYRPAEILPDGVKEYFKGRGISDAVLIRHKIEKRTIWLKDETTQKSFEVGAVAFPYFRGTEVVNVKYRTRDKQWRMETGCELILYKVNDIDPRLPLYWTEGEIDALSLDEVGFRNCVSVPNGAGSKDFSYFETIEEMIDSVPYHIIAGDNDIAGRALQSELIRRIGPERCHQVKWPEGCKDANDVLVKHGREMLVECLNNAEPVPIEGLFTVQTLSQKVLDLYENDLPSGPEITAAISAIYKPRPREWTVVTGIPSMGKSSWLDWFLVQLVAQHGWPIAICSPENQPLERHIAGILSIVMDKPFRTGPSARMSKEEVQMGMEWMNGFFSFILPEETPSIDTILDLARCAVTRKGIRGLVVDPWNELDHSRPAYFREDEYIGRNLSKIRQFARTYDVHVWVVAHPRIQRKNAAGEYDVPTPYDISGAAHWYNKADFCLCVHRDKTNENAPTEVYVQKVRFRENGKVGMVQMNYDKLTAGFRDVQTEF